MRKYFITVMVESAPTEQFIAQNDEEAIEIARQEYNETTCKYGTVRELCVHRIDDNGIMPIFSRNFALATLSTITGSDGQPQPYDLGLPVTIRQSLERQTEISQSREWPSEAEEKEVEATREELERVIRNLGNSFKVTD